MVCKKCFSGVNIESPEGRVEQERAAVERLPERPKRAAERGKAASPLDGHVRRRRVIAAENRPSS
jgi:hypothetical protein